MINPKILVTGATGKTGGAVVRELLAKAFQIDAGEMVEQSLELCRRALAPKLLANLRNEK